MNATIAALACAPFLVTALVAQSRPQGNDPSSIGSPSFFNPSLDRLGEPSMRSSDGLEWESAGASPSLGSERLEGRPGDIVVAFLDALEPGEYSLSDLPLRSAVFLGVVGNDGEFELREVPDRLVAGAVALAVLPLASSSPPRPLVARVCLYTLPSGPIVCGCTGTPGWDNLDGGADAPVLAVRFQGKGLFAGGDFNNIGSTAANHVARWNGNSWNGLQGGLSGVIGGGFASPYVDSLEPYKGRMYVGGHFLNAGSTATNHVASYKASTGWLDVGGGVQDPGNVIVRILDMVRFNDGGGNDLYVAGDFATAGGTVVKDIARWDGSVWSDVGGGTDFHDQVDELGVYNNGGSSVLVASGGFLDIGGISANQIAQWDGSNWAPMGSGVNDVVNAIVQFGSDLYVAGLISVAGGVSVSNIARWDGSAWSDVGGGTDFAIWDLAVFNDGSGPALIAAGFFTTAGGVPARGLAKWDGSSWSTFAGGDLVGQGYTLDAKNGCLAVGGNFSSAGGTPASNIAIWRRCCH